MVGAAEEQAECVNTFAYTYFPSAENEYYLRKVNVAGILRTIIEEADDSITVAGSAQRKMIMKLKTTHQNWWSVCLFISFSL